MKKQVTCRKCGSNYHYQSFCPLNRKPLPRSTKPIAVRKRPKQNPETKREWLAIRSKWLISNPPNHMGYYECYLCKKWVDYTEITLDHVIPRSNAANFAHRNDDDNLRPCCAQCNSLKGSKHANV